MIILNQLNKMSNTINLKHVTISIIFFLMSIGYSPIALPNTNIDQNIDQNESHNHAEGMDNDFMDNWLWINTQERKLMIMNQYKPIKTYTGARFGRGGIGKKAKKGDKITPVGLYRIGWENTRSQFGHFYGLTYPSIEDANRGLINKKIKKETYLSIIKAHQNNQIPPQNTQLGGSVGIHGLGKKSPEIHDLVNWTFGCIALTNEQINDAAHYIKLGMKVIIN